MARLVILLFLLGPVFAADFRGRQFISLGEVRTDAAGVYTSPLIAPALAQWDELIVSWNFRNPDAGLSVEAQVIYPEVQTKWYSLGKWSADPSKHPRESVKDQRDEHGTVDTDTLRAKKPGGAVRVRLRSTEPHSKVKLLGLCFADTKAHDESLPPNTNAWGKSLAVEERSQADYPEGISEWCSPTAVSMLLSFWAEKLKRPELNHSVPETARGVNDPNWPGTGNWPFNMAFAGAHGGMRAYVSRLSDVSELEDWIERGIPVAFSAAYGILKGSSERGNGHLLVGIGFTEAGDIVVNDPGRREVRQTYTRANLIKAWAESQNTVYLVYPETAAIPADRFGHWMPAR